MAGVITHLVIADKMLKYLPEGIIKNKGLFYLGSFAPDAIHAREGYIREYKKHTHFRDEIPDRDFEEPEYFTQYKERLIDFIHQNKDRKDELLDLYRGYVVHILTDELFMLSIRKEFCEVMRQLGIDQNDKPFFDNIVRDMNRNDMLLVHHYDNMNEIKLQLELVSMYPIDGYISVEEMQISRDWLLDQHFYKGHEILQPDYISYKRMLTFIHNAAEQITKRLTDGVNLPRIL